MLVIILTGPRSGSSMVAEIVHKLGISMGNSFNKADCWNQKGYFEDVQLLGLHRVMAFARDEPDRVMMRLPSCDPKPTRRQLKLYRMNIDQRKKAHANWGIKDPQFVYLWDRIRPIFEDQEVKVIVCTRNRDDSTASLMEMFNLMHSEATTIVNDYQHRLDHVRAVCHDPLLVIDYDEAMTAVPEVPRKIAEFLGLPLTPQAQSVVDPRLRRHARNVDLVEDQSGIIDNSKTTSGSLSV